MKQKLKELNPFNNVESDNKIIYMLKILLKTFLVYFIGILVAEAIIMIMHYPFGYDPMGKLLPADVLLLASYYGYIIPILFFILLVKKFSKDKLISIGVDKNFKTFFKGIGLGLLSLIIIMGILLVTNAVTFNGFNKGANYLIIGLFLFGYLIQSFMEEIICRGYLLHKLKGKLSIYLASIVSILFFSILHFSKLFECGVVLGIIGSLNLILISVIWVLLTLKDNNIYSATGFHFIWNYTLFNIIGLNVSGLETNNSIFKFSANNSFLTGSNYGIESSIITALVLAIILALLFFKSKKTSK